MTVATRPEIPLQVITPADVRASIRRARQGLERAAEEIVWQIEMEAWRTLGYSSWGAMREAEYGGAAFMVPSKSRRELVARIRAAGITQQEVAATAGVNVRTIKRDERSSTEGTNVPSDSDEDIVDAELVEDDDSSTYIDRATGEVFDTPQKATDPAPAEPVNAITCPTCEPPPCLQCLRPLHSNLTRQRGLCAACWALRDLPTPDERKP
ncbi:hypothetical protein [Naumannella halotolerans]|uniref:Uncharacterized protein n=1 Tax=Naumannella halotolerans TaxID=993414 RepID=A0A4R7J1J7_9ACTN|nr:hypothetical protein [Naumannella halotolerans]TDT30885.1 hypothetical protein CLV29_2292 [Naumannella halotolerans]